MGAPGPAPPGAGYIDRFDRFRIPYSGSGEIRLKTTRYLSPPTGCETTAQIVQRCGGSLVLRDQGERVTYALPESASAEVKQFLGTHATCDFDPSFVAQIPGGRVFGSGNVLAPDAKTIARDVSPDFGKAFEEHWLLTYGKIPAATAIAGRTAVIATTLGIGYSHWLLEELPRLLVLKEVEGCDAIIAHGAKPFARAAIAKGGFPVRIIEAKRNAHFACEELVVPSVGRMTPATVRALEEFGRSISVAAPSFGEKIYISRAGARRRRITNEESLGRSLENNGFTCVHLEALTWAEQIAAFRSARVIVAPHGAGLANLVFCQPGTRVIELFNRSYVNGCYWQLAALKRLDYRPLVSPGDDPLGQLLNANRRDIEADLVSVMRALGAG